MFARDGQDLRAAPSLADFSCRQSRFGRHDLNAHVKISHKTRSFPWSRVRSCSTNEGTAEKRTNLVSACHPQPRFSPLVAAVHRGEIMKPLTGFVKKCCLIAENAKYPALELYLT